MNLRRWQRVWTALVVLWLGGWASPMVLLMLSGDIEQLHIYFGMWVAVVLIPTVVLYLVVLLVGRFAQSKRATAADRPPTRRRSAWFAGSLIWVFLVAIFCAAAPAALNPFARWAMPLAVTVAVFIAMLPPLLIYAVLPLLPGLHSKDGHQ